MKGHFNVTEKCFYEQNKFKSDLSMQQAKYNLLERANQLILLCRNADFSADQTMITLADQGEQLANIESYLSSMDVKLADTKQDINRLKGTTKRVMDSFRSKCHRKFLTKILTHIKKDQDSIIKPQRVCSIDIHFFSHNDRLFFCLLETSLFEINECRIVLCDRRTN